ncbi:MAG: hypothetical protein QMD09_01925 [Desulfatibacillaceae bacterium]|nr:hypothetical protein [Desulfatibacillaceae bacterium]
MLGITIFMNTSMEEVIAFKCCALPDQNLEIHLHNTGKEALSIKSRFVLDDGPKPLTITAVYPPTGIKLAPGQTAAIYTSMDERVWEQYRSIRFEEQGGIFHSFAINTNKG